MAINVWTSVDHSEVAQGMADDKEFCLDVLEHFFSLIEGSVDEFFEKYPQHGGYAALASQMREFADLLSKEDAV